MSVSYRKAVFSILLFCAVLIIGAALYRPALLGYLLYPWRVLTSRDVEDVLNTYGSAVDTELKPLFARAGLDYPPARLLLLAYKKEKRLEVRVPKDKHWLLLRTYPVLAASGKSGPKLREGDYQVPEGIYHLEYLNPNSRFHLSMKLDYPNAFDRAKAVKDGRGNLGGDIFIHGKDVSIGCLAIGDKAIEELFVLTARTGRENVTVLVFPQEDMQNAAPAAHNPEWITELYDKLRLKSAELLL